MGETVTALEQVHPGEVIEVHYLDEARLGLKPILRRVWAKRGSRPTGALTPGYEWLWLYAAVHPPSGRVFWLILPFLNASMTQLFLDLFAQEIPVGHQAVLVLDGSGAHTAACLSVPERVKLVFLPPYSPELQPAERLWPLVREGLANRGFQDLDELQGVTCARCETLSERPELVSALTTYEGYPTT